MATRTTKQKVGSICTIDEVHRPVVDGFIETAANIVTRICVPAGYDDETLELIERYLAAHFYALDDPALISEGGDGTSAVYERGLTGRGLNATRWGQQAMALDTENALDALKPRRKARVLWGGKPYSEQDHDALD